MLQNIREDVTRTVARIDFQFQEPEPMPLPELPDFLTTHIDPFTGEDNSADIDGGALGVIADTLPPMAAPRPDLPEGENPYAGLEISRNAPCPCGSGRKYQQIGRASCRERVCQYVYISVVAVSLKKKKNKRQK